MTIIKSFKDVSFNSLFLAFNQAFADYEMQLSKEELQVMLKRRGFVPELSFGAFDGDKIVAFTFNGIGQFNGMKTAYDTGTGTLKEYRGKGLASDVFNYSIPFLKDADIKQYLLEVLQHNTKAVSIYKKLGFIVSREFNYFIQDVDNIKILLNRDNPGYFFKSIDFSQINAMKNFWDFNPSWQNSFESISRSTSDYRIIGTFLKEDLVAYGIIEPKSGDITQIAVHKEHRRKGIGTALLNEVLKMNAYNSIKVINTQIDCTTISEFLKSNSIDLKGKQFEMIKEL